MRLFCDGYGLTDPEGRCGLLDVAGLQLVSLFITLKTKAAEGDPFCVAAWEQTNGGEATLADFTCLR